MEYPELYDLILDKIKSNGTHSITGSVLQEVCLDLLDFANTHGGGGGGGDTPGETHDVTYAELAAIKSAGTLVPNDLYHITDYNTIVDSRFTDEVLYQSAGHAFDLTVKATGTNTLSEEATASLHEGDTYFAKCDLSKWKIWYCFDNDLNRFGWASTEGKGVIYRMIDEYDNDCPYDFKNIQFRRCRITSIGPAFSFLQDTIVGDRGWFVNSGSSYTGLNPLTVDFSSEYWFYTFSTFQASQKGALPGVSDEILEATVFQANTQWPSIHGNVIGEKYGEIDPENFDLTGRVLNMTVFITGYEEYEEEGETEIWVGQIYGANLPDTKADTFIYTSNISITGESYANIVIGGNGTTAKNLTGNTIVGEGNTFDEGASRIAFMGSGNLFLKSASRLTSTANVSDCIMLGDLSNMTINCKLFKCQFDQEICYLTITSATPNTNATFIHFLSGTRGTAASPIIITLPNVDTRYCTFVGRTSGGQIKIWVPADEATGVSGGGGDWIKSSELCLGF